MKHEEIYHTCDRCGKKFDMPISDITDSQYPRWITKWKPTAREHELLTANSYAYLEEHKDDFIPGVDSVVIVGNYFEKREKFDLCGDCRKAFERFMKNEKDN